MFFSKNFKSQTYGALNGRINPRSSHPTVSKNNSHGNSDTSVNQKHDRHFYKYVAYVQKFVQILKKNNNFFSRLNIHYYFAISKSNRKKNYFNFFFLRVDKHRLLFLVYNTLVLYLPGKTLESRFKILRSMSSNGQNLSDYMRFSFRFYTHRVIYNNGIRAELLNN